MLSNWLIFFALVIHFVYIKHPPFSGKHSSGNWSNHTSPHIWLYLIVPERVSDPSQVNQNLWTHGQQRENLKCHFRGRLGDLGAASTCFWCVETGSIEPTARDGESWDCTTPGAHSSRGIRWRLALTSLVESWTFSSRYFSCFSFNPENPMR